MTAPVLLLPVLADKRAKGWPESPLGRPALYMPPAEVFGRRYSTDAHCAAYSVPDRPRRLATPEALVQLAPQGGVPMVLTVFDLDAPSHQVTGRWLDEQLPKFEFLQEQHPGLFTYRTRGGYRLVWRLDQPVVLRDRVDASRWRYRYLRWCCYLARRFDLVADPSCADWTRLYRLPHATRESGGQPEQLPIWGDPGELGAWEVDPADEDIDVDVAMAHELAVTWKLWAPVAMALAGGHGLGVQPPLPADGFKPEPSPRVCQGGEPPPPAQPPKTLPVPTSNGVLKGPGGPGADAREFSLNENDAIPGPGPVDLRATGAVDLRATGAVDLRATGAVDLRATGAVDLRATGLGELGGTELGDLGGAELVKPGGPAGERHGGATLRTGPPPGPGGADRWLRRAEGYAHHALRRAAEELRATPAGHGRNNLLNAKAFAMGRLAGAGLLGEAEVEHQLFEAARAAGLPADEARATLRSGLQAGLGRPRLPDLVYQPGGAPQEGTPYRTYKGAPSRSPSLPHRLGEPSSSKRNGELGSFREKDPIVAGGVPVLDPWAFNTDDLGNASRLVARHGADLRYCYPWQKWIVWDGRRWRPDDTGEVERRAKETARSISGEAAAIVGTDAAAELRRKELGAWARRVGARERLSAMVALAESEEGMAVLPPELDADPWQLNCLNGTLDLRTGELLPHRREDLLTKLVPVAYDPGATCPTWKAFLDVILRGDADVIGFLQRFVGYALTGTIREHVLVVCYGTGSNGKSTFLETVSEMLGDYAWQAPPDLLLVRSLEAHPTDLAGLHGARFATCLETASGRRLDEARMKMLTGGDRVTARRMREDFWTFRPTHKLALGTNHKPAVATTDHGTWRRQRVVPFTVQIPNEHQDTHLPEKLRAELPGILRWALEGCLAWQRDGLGEARAIRQATDAWRDEGDALGTFLTACCEHVPRATVPAGELYAKYMAWCRTSGEEPLRKVAFGQRLTERGFETRKGAGGVRLWRGLELLEQKSSVGTPGGD
jgi:P4 family phage/plasmid primase-like protien